MIYSPFRHVDSILWKRAPIHLTVFLTKRCNAKCRHCFYIHDKNLSNRDNDELSLDEIKKLSASMGKLLWLAFSGGEIFLRDDIVEIAKIFYRNNKPAIMLFPTNGLLTDKISRRIEEILKHCNKSTIAVKLSLDGPERLHDSMRGAEGSFRKTMQTYNALGRLLNKYPNFELGINTVFSSENQDSMDELIEFVNSLENIKTHTVSLIRGDVSDDGLKGVDIKKYLETIQNIESNLKKKRASIYRFRGARIKAAQDIIQRRLIHETMLQKKQLIPCYAGKLNLVITETGDIFPCESFSMRLGNIRESDYDIERVLRSVDAQKVVSSIKKKGCFCTHECYMMTNILFNPFMYPALLKKYLQM
ncbi:MAG: radical SAM protein [Nitrospirae bacterium]|nr:radical SAM protein [Nitrospirota bacterium]